MAKAKKSEATLTLEEKLEQALIADEEQPYKAPDNWCWVELQLLCSIPITDGTHKTPKYCDADNGIPFISAKDVTGQYINWENIKYITMELHEELHKRLAPQINDILLAKNGTTGVAAIVDTEKIFDIYVTLAILRINSNIAVPKYVLHLINSPICKIQFDEHLTGIGVPNLHLRDIKVTQIPFPPLAEQQRIVDRIERLYAKLDEVKENVQNVIDSFENRKSAILHKAFNGKLTAKWREENHIDRELWESKSIADLFTHTTGKALKKDNKEGILHKYITTSNLYWGMFDFTEVRKMYFTDREIDKCTAKKGDLLICNGGDVGRAAIWDYDYDICLQNHISKLRKKQDNLEVRFFFYYFMLSKLKGNINSKGIGISSLSAKDLLAMSVKLPTLQEQIEIVRILDNILLKQQQAKEKAEDVLEKIELIKKSILARAFRGELGTNNPDEESSIELLKTVLSEDKDEKTISKPESK